MPLRAAAAEFPRAGENWSRRPSAARSRAPRPPRGLPAPRSPQLKRQIVMQKGIAAR